MSRKSVTGKNNSCDSNLNDCKTVKKEPLLASPVQTDSSDSVQTDSSDLVQSDSTDSVQTDSTDSVQTDSSDLVQSGSTDSIKTGTTDSGLTGPTYLVQSGPIGLIQSGSTDSVQGGLIKTRLTGPVKAYTGSVQPGSANLECYDSVQNELTDSHVLVIKDSEKRNNNIDEERTGLR